MILHIYAETTQIGLEPTTSAVTGRRSNQLSHWAIPKMLLLYTFKTTYTNTFLTPFPLALE